jgi:hypothetical protein
MLVAGIATPASGSNVMASGGLRSRAMYAAHHPYLSKISPADTDTSVDTGTVDHSSRRRGGYVITEDQLVGEQDFSLGSVLVAHFPGIRVVHGSEIDRVASRLNLDMTGAPCFLQVFVDGVYIQNGGVDWVSVRNLSAIEYRTPGNVPVQYQNREPGAMCGVLLLWSKYS